MNFLLRSQKPEVGSGISTGFFAGVDTEAAMQFPERGNNKSVRPFAIKGEEYWMLLCKMGNI
ncbi:MAG: hypothetical protein AB1611_08230 [bacterium]